MNNLSPRDGTIALSGISSITDALTERVASAIASTVAELEDSAVALAADAAKLVIVDEKSAEPVLSLRRRVLDDLESRLGPARDTMLKCHRAITGPIGEIKKVVDAAQAVVSKKIGAWREARRLEAEQAERAKIEAERAARLAELETVLNAAERRGDDDTVETVIGEAAKISEPVPTPVVSAPRVASKSRRTFEPIVESADLVPRSFCSPDLKKLREHASKTNGAPVPGVRFDVRETYF